MEFILERYNYWIIILLMMGGLYIIFASENAIKKLVGLSIFQTSLIVFYVTLGKVAGGTAPILVSSGHHGDDHGDSHGDDHSDKAAHGAAGHDEGHGNAYESHEPDAHADPAHGADAGHAADAHDASVHMVDVHHAASGGGHGGDIAHAAGEVIYSNPLPHVLMLTAIVVGVATLSVGLALVVRVREAYGTIEMDDVRAADIAEGEAEGSAA